MFYGISTPEGYLMPNLHKYILNMYDCKHLMSLYPFFGTQLNGSKSVNIITRICLDTAKLAQVMRYNSHNLASILCLHTVCQ